MRFSLLLGSMEVDLKEVGAGLDGRRLKYLFDTMLESFLHSIGLHPMFFNFNFFIYS